jgi:hypothetical protein
MGLKRLNIYRKFIEGKPKPQSKESKEFAEMYRNMTLEEMDRYFDEEYKRFCENNPLHF